MTEPKIVVRRDVGIIDRPRFIKPRTFEGPSFAGWGPKLG